MEQKIKIKLGALEIEYEGNENYLKNDLPNLIDKLTSLHIPIISSISEISNENEVLEATNASDAREIKQMAVNTIAAKLGGKTGSELAIVACAHLSLMQNLDTFNRLQVLAEMKKATNYYKNSYSKNFSNILKTLVNSHKLIERTSNNYALSANELNRIKSILGGN